MTEQTEIWKDIPGLEGRYQASDLGRIKGPQGIRKLYANKEGYQSCNYRGPGRISLEFRVHRAVLLAFVGSDPKRTFVNHKNSNPSDNRLENLEWCTPAENMQHAREHGRASDMKGENNPRAKLTRDEVKDILAMRERGLYYREIADHFGISLSMAGYILTGKAWKCTGFHDERHKPRPRGSLTEAQVIEAIKRLNDGESLSSIGRRYGVSHCTIADIRDGKSWKALGAKYLDLPTNHRKAPKKPSRKQAQSGVVHEGDTAPSSA